MMAVLAMGASADTRQAQQGTQTDRAAAVRIADTRARAERGNADAQFALGLMYVSGNVVPNDDAQAAGWFRKAAEQGHAPAQWALGILLDEGGIGVPQDFVQAVEWFRKAAEQGYWRRT
jgi:hypothetical protein